MLFVVAHALCNCLELKRTKKWTKIRGRCLPLSLYSLRYMYGCKSLTRSLLPNHPVNSTNSIYQTKTNHSKIKMNLVELRDIRLSIGPGIRGTQCNVCIEEIKPSHETVTHIGCENTFHSACLDSWADSNNVQSRSTTCPLCRAPLGGADGRESETLSILTTVESEMYDYEMDLESSRLDGNFPTPAYLHRFHHQYRQAVDWMGDYFVRYCRAQNLTEEAALAHIMQYYQLQRNLSFEWAVQAMETEVGDGESVTDLEIIDWLGQRRPRPTVVDFFQEHPTQACEWLDRRMSRTQRNLGLDADLMRQTRSAFMDKVHQEIRRRQSATRSATRGTRRLGR